MSFFNFFLNHMVLKYQNEISPILYYGISTKINEKDLKIPYLQLPDWKSPYWMTVYVIIIQSKPNHLTITICVLWWRNTNNWRLEIQCKLHLFWMDVPIFCFQILAWKHISRFLRRNSLKLSVATLLRIQKNVKKYSWPPVSRDTNYTTF